MPLSVNQGAPRSSELDYIKSRHVTFLSVTHCGITQCIKDPQKISAIVSTIEQGDHHLLGHNNERKVL